jgi:hypothetical protein
MATESVARSRAHVTTPFSPIDRLANRITASAMLTRLCALKGTDAECYQAAVDMIAGAARHTARDSSSERTRCRRRCDALVRERPPMVLKAAKSPPPPTPQAWPPSISPAAPLSGAGSRPNS